MLKTITLAALMALTESISLEQCCNTCACGDHDHDNEMDKEELIDIIDDVIDDIPIDGGDTP